MSLYLLLAKGLSKIKQQNQNIVTDEKVNIDQICKEMALYTLQIVHLPKCKTGKNIAIDRLTVYLFCSETSSH